MSTPPAILFLAKTAAELTGAAEIQLFPPGVQVVSPTPADGTAVQELTLTIDAATATDLEASRAALQAKCDAGEGDRPFIDFNHDDREAAAWPLRIFWAGEDPITGGVRAEVEWSSAGQEAVSGKLFRRFSPAFYATDGRVTGAPVNMGGLVNRAAFAKIAPLFAKQNETLTPPPPPTMNPEEITALQTENTALKQRVAELETQLTDKQAALEAHARKDAEAIVALAAKEGRIAPAAEVQSKWVGAILANPDSKDLLLAMAPNPALATVIQATAAKDDPAALLAKFLALPREEQPAFYRANAAALKGTLK